MTGPCLCGDPYCPYCGSPGAAAYEAAIEEMLDRLEAENLDEFELQLFEQVGLAAVEAHRKANKDLQDMIDAENHYASLEQDIIENIDDLV